MHYHKITRIAFIICFLILAPVWTDAQLPNLGPTSWGDLINGIAKYVFDLGMVAAVIVIIWSGIVFMTAGGNEQRITSAKKTFFWALVGLAICLIGLGFVDLIKDILGAK